MAQDRHPAYAELIAALLSLRPDPATDRFDGLLSELVARDRLDPEDARALRWWQREAVRAVGDYVAEAVPSLLVGLESSQRAAAESAAAAAAAWRSATGDAAAAASGPTGSDPRPGPGPTESTGGGADRGSHLPAPVGSDATRSGTQAEGSDGRTAGGPAGLIARPDEAADAVIDLRTPEAGPGPRPVPGTTRGSTASAATLTTPTGGVPSARRRLLLPSGSLPRHQDDVRP